MKNILLLRLKKIPGGILLVPMAISSFLYTFFPNLLRIGAPTESLFSEYSTMVLLGLILFIAGTQINVFELRKVYKKAFSLILMKFVLATFSSLIFINYFEIKLVESITLVAVLFSTNPGYYLAVSPSDNKSENQAIFAFLHLVVLPNIPIILMNMNTGSNIDFLGLFSTFFPFLLGLLIKNIFIDIEELYSNGTKILMPFLGFSFGTKVNLFSLLDGFVSGLLVTSIFIAVIVLPMYFLEKKVLGFDGKSSLSMGTVAGLTLSVPVLADIPNKGSVISQISIAIILTSIFIPLLTKKLVDD